MTGCVYLVGAGPGDPGLLTLTGRDRLAQADVVVHDDLVPSRLLDFVRRDAEVVAVGPVHATQGRLAQPEIEALLIDRARSGKLVVRLKNGDPTLFGRGGEEAATLAAAGVPFEIVPGVTSALAVPAYAGIPVTHRDHASMVTIATGHQASSSDGTASLPLLDWEALARRGGTLVFLMGVRQAAVILDRLREHGLPAETPAALVRWGTTARQETVVADAGTLARVIADRGLTPPGVLIVGGVVTMRAHLSWIERRPLFGRRVVVTRARAQAAALAERLEALGAEVVCFPTIDLVPRLDDRGVQRAIADAGTFDWIVFTSVNGVRVFVDGMRAKEMDVRVLAGVSLAAIGSETARALRAHLLEPALVPDDFRAEGLVAAFATVALEGRRVLLPRAAGSRSVLPEALQARGATVVDVPIYQAVMPADTDVGSLRDGLAAGEIAAITFTSSSTARNFATLVGRDAAALVARGGAAVACIGPVTAETAQAAGFRVDVQPTIYTVDALAQALARHFCTTGGDALSRSEADW